MNYPIRNAKQRIYTGRMRAWIKANNSGACLGFVAEMTQSKNPDALPALMELLRPPSSLYGYRRGATLCEAREAAVHAILHIDAPDALSCIGTALFHPCTEVRTAASQILSEAGTDAAEPLARLLTWRQNWSVEGICILLYLLGSSKNPNAAQPLIRVLKSELPLVPPRRANDVHLELLPVFMFEAILLVTLIATTGFYFGDASKALMGFLGLSFAVTAFVVSMMRSAVPHNEQQPMAIAACEALQLLGDKKAIPALLAATESEERARAEAAKSAFYSLLPMLDSKDTDWLPMEARQKLANLLHQREPEWVLPVLKAMEFVGSGVAERRIAALMTHGATPQIRAEAARIHPILLERERQAKVAGTLLRASQQPETSQDELLRPVVANPDNAPKELLRSSTGQGE